MRFAAGINITMVTFMDCENVEHYSLALRNKACYAAQHGYSYRVKLIREKSRAGMITYEKPGVIGEALLPLQEEEEEEEREAGWVVWVDADVVITDASRPFETFFGDAADLWLTDHNCNPNNGVLAFRKNQSWSRDFVRKWQEVCEMGRFPFTDQGCFYEQLLVAAANVSVVESCGLLETKRKPDVMACVMRAWNEVFGPFDAARDRVVARVGLRRAADGFNNHYCSPSHAKTYCRWATPPGWDRALCFRDGMFALHGRSAARALAMHLPGADYDSASLRDPNLALCVRFDDQKLTKTLAGACADLATSKKRSVWANLTLF